MRLVASENKPVALWSVPRSISTAFERVFVERDDLEFLHEPFSAAYYFSEDRPSDRYADEERHASHHRDLPRQAPGAWLRGSPGRAHPTKAYFRYADEPTATPARPDVR